MFSAMRSAPSRNRSSTKILELHTFIQAIHEHHLTHRSKRVELELELVQGPFECIACRQPNDDIFVRFADYPDRSFVKLWSQLFGKFHVDPLATKPHDTAEEYSLPEKDTYNSAKVFRKTRR